VSMVKILSTLPTAKDWSEEIDEQRLEIAIDSYRPEAMVSLLVNHAQQSNRSIKVTSKALVNAAKNKSLKILFKLLREQDVRLIENVELLEAAAAAAKKSQIELLINYAAEMGATLPVGQTVFEHAVKGSKEAVKAILSFWKASG
jgi:hypothetical protein